MRVPRQVPKKVVPSFIGKSGQVANWLFYNGAGNVLYDFSGGKNHGDINGPKWVDGSYGWALDFDGADDYVGFPDVGIGSGEDYSISAWIKPSPSGHPSGDVECAVGLYGTMDSRLLGYDDSLCGTTGAMGFAIYDGAMHTACSGSDLRGSWHHAVAVRDADSGMKLYVDGSLADSNTYTGTANSKADSNAIGQRGDGAKFFLGRVDKVHIYDRVLSESEIAGMYEETKPLYVD